MCTKRAEAPQADRPPVSQCPDKHPPIVPPRKWLQTSHCSLMSSRTVFTPSSLNKEAACEASDWPTNLTPLLSTANEIPLLPPALGDSTPTPAGREDGRFVLQPWQPHLGQAVDVSDDVGRDSPCTIKMAQSNITEAAQREAGSTNHGPHQLESCWPVSAPNPTAIGL